MNRTHIAFIVILLSLCSCINTKKATYFSTETKSGVSFKPPIPQSLIDHNDLLNISVSSLNPSATVIFNSPNTLQSGTSIPAQQSSGYLVNTNGFIQFPILGEIKASGLSINQLRELIVKKLLDKELLVDPIVSIRHLNFKISVLGEVARPSVINVPNEKISLIEALSMAGDITIYGKRDNVMIIREEQGAQVINRINLNTTALFESPFYFLKSNDIIYVEPNKARVASSGRTNQLLPIVLSGLSFAAIIIDRATRN